MKRQFIHSLLFALAGTVLLPSFAAAAKRVSVPAPTPYQACRAQDLVGTWQMIQQTSPNPISPEDPFYFAYQRYVFTPEGGMKHLTSIQPITEKQKENQGAAPLISNFQVDAAGSVTVRRKDSQKTQRFLCTAITQNSKDLNAPMKAGDLLLSYYVQKDKPPILQRLLRKEAADPSGIPTQKSR